MSSTDHDAELGEYIVSCTSNAAATVGYSQDIANHLVFVLLQAVVSSTYNGQFASLVHNLCIYIPVL